MKRGKEGDRLKRVVGHRWRSKKREKKREKTESRSLDVNAEKKKGKKSSAVRCSFTLGIISTRQSGKKKRKEVKERACQALPRTRNDEGKRENSRKNMPEPEKKRRGVGSPTDQNCLLFETRGSGKEKEEKSGATASPGSGYSPSTTEEGEKKLKTSISHDLRQGFRGGEGKREGNLTTSQFTFADRSATPRRKKRKNCLLLDRRREEKRRVQALNGFVPQGKGRCPSDPVTQLKKRRRFTIDDVLRLSACRREKKTETSRHRSPEVAGQREKKKKRVTFICLLHYLLPRNERKG